MMGRRCSDQASLLHQFRFDERAPKERLLKRIEAFVTAALADVHQRPKPYHRDIGRPLVDPEPMRRMLWTSRPRSDHDAPKNAGAGKGHAG